MASSNSGVAHDTGEAMDVHPQHEEKPTSSSMSISTAEQMEMDDISIVDSPVDSDVDERTKNTPTTSDSFPKYVDCYETLKEVAFFKWITGFRSECRKILCIDKTELFFGLFYLFYKIIMPQEVIGCRNKINKSSLVKSYLEQSMLFFQGFYKTIKKNKGDTLDVIYYDGMTSMVAYFIDLELMSNQRFKENPSHKKISNKINSMLFGFLDQKIEYIFDSVFQLFYLFNVKRMPNVESIMLPVCRKLLSNHPMPRKINFLTYMRYILCFKLWKRLINNSSSMGESVKRNKLEILTKYLEQLNVPNDFMSQYEKYNWPNWPTFPKSIMYSNKKQHSSQTDLKKISLFLYDENFPLKKCYKDILNAAPEKDIQMKPILEQCTILRPDLFAISKKELLKNWNEHYDDTLNSHIPTTPSLNSLMRKIKYDLVPITDDLSKLTLSGEGSENQSFPNIYNFLHYEKKSIKPTNLINSSTNKIIDESNNGRSEENEKSSGEAFKTSNDLPANVKKESSEDEIQVNEKKSKSSEKHVLNGDDGRFDPTLSDNPSRLNYISEITSTSNHPESSNSKESKRN